MILYVGIHPRYFTEPRAKTHVCKGVNAKVAICYTKIFGVFGTLTPEDKDDPNLCMRCRDKVDWSKVENREKVWLEMESLYE